MSDPETPSLDPADLGGDPACWAHLLDDEGKPVIDDAALTDFVGDVADEDLPTDGSGF